jgi:hypothetical protein
MFIATVTEVGFIEGLVAFGRIHCCPSADSPVLHRSVREAKSTSYRSSKIITKSPTSMLVGGVRVIDPSACEALSAGEVTHPKIMIGAVTVGATVPFSDPTSLRSVAAMFPTTEEPTGLSAYPAIAQVVVSPIPL